MDPKPSNVAGVLLSQLAAWGIRTIYGVAGDAVIPLLDAIRYREDVRYIAVRCESAAAFMASTEGKCTGRIGVCLGTSGPGLANMLNGIADTAADRVPMLVITGQVPRGKVGTGAKQYIDQEQLISPLAVYSASILDPNAVLTVVNKAVVEAVGKRGVAHVSVPMDVLALPCSLAAHAPTGLLQQTQPSNLSQLDACVEALNAARKPLLYIGRGARRAASAIRQLAETLQAGILETLGAKGTIPADDEWHIGGIGEGGTQEAAELLKQADCLLIIGANWYPQPYVPREIRVIKIDIDPGSIEAQPDIAHGLVGDAAHAAEQLASKLRRQDRGEWAAKVRAAKETITRRLDRERISPGGAISPQALMAALERRVAADGIIAVDTGDHTIWFNRIFRAKRQFVTFSGKWRTMGFALPAAISAKLHYPDKQVTAIVGDGCFAVTAMELSTMVKYHTPIKIIIANNHAFAAEKNKMAAAGLKPYGVDLANPDFSALARAYGIKGLKVQHPDELSDALQAMYADDQAMLLDVHITDDSPILQAP
jgi:pyruvate dehydrogenase (quinone)/pyruvate oxidase